MINLLANTGVPTEPGELIIFIGVILGGLGLFLYGITSISTVLKRIASDKLRNILAKASDKPIIGALLGAGFTAVIQSSSATSALTIGFVRASVLTLIQAAAILIGANIGTAITAFIISIPFAEYMAFILFIGSFILLLVTKRKWVNIGELFFAIGCIFFGLTIMGDNLKLLASEPWFVNLFTGLDSNPWLGLLIGTGATALVQSSSAVIGIVQIIYASSEGAVTIFGILPILFGANIGTTVTALISCIGGSKESKRVALFHVFFNVFGALLFMGVIYIAKPWLDTSPSWSAYVSEELQLALCHLVFNLVTSIIFLPLLKPICKLLEKIVPGGNNRSELIAVKELDNNLIKNFPAQGIALAKEQVLIMFSYSKTMFEVLNAYINKPNKEDGDFIRDIEASIDRIDRQLNEYLGITDKATLNPSDVLLLSQTLKSCKDIERIGDYGENLIDFYENANERKEKFEGLALDTLKLANNNAISIIDKTIKVLTEGDYSLALEVIQQRRDYIKITEEDIQKYFDVMLDNTNPTRKSKYIDLVFVDMVNCYERVYSHCSNIAKLFAQDKEYKFSIDEQLRFEKMKDRY